ncbi:hypothetical protein DJ71_22965 [Halorubrum sp. E3]|nr:hypothetical protein DJ71_22965 [Halorubrum sp. E3]
MTPPSRTLGIAFSDGDRTSRLAGAIVRDDGTPDGFAFATCTVGGTDATDAVIDCWRALDREDVRHVACAGVAPAWFNLLDLDRLREALDRPVYAVSYEASPGLEPALRDAFDGDALAQRLDAYRSLPPRARVERGGSGPTARTNTGSGGSLTVGPDPPRSTRARGGRDRYASSRCASASPSNASRSAGSSPGLSS